MHGYALPRGGDLLCKVKIGDICDIALCHPFVELM